MNLKATQRADSLAAIVVRLRSSLDTARRGGSNQEPGKLVDALINDAKALKKELRHAA